MNYNFKLLSFIIIINYLKSYHDPNTPFFSSRTFLFFKFFLCFIFHYFLLDKEGSFSALTILGSSFS